MSMIIVVFNGTSIVIDEHCDIVNAEIFVGRKYSPGQLQSNFITVLSLVHRLHLALAFSPDTSTRKHYAIMLHAHDKGRLR